MYERTYTQKNNSEKLQMKKWRNIDIKPNIFTRTGKDDLIIIKPAVENVWLLSKELSTAPNYRLSKGLKQIIFTLH